MATQTNTANKNQEQANKKASKAKKKSLKGITSGIVLVQATFNNTIITITDRQGNVIVWATPGLVGFSGSKKSTPFAAQVAATDAARRAKDLGLLTVDILVKGPGSGMWRLAAALLRTTGSLLSNSSTCGSSATLPQ